MQIIGLVHSVLWRQPFPLTSLRVLPERDLWIPLLLNSITKSLSQEIPTDSFALREKLKMKLGLVPVRHVSPPLQTLKCLYGVSLKVVVLPKGTSLRLEFEDKNMKMSNEGHWRYFSLWSKAGESRNPTRKLTLSFFSLVQLTWTATKFQTSEFQLSTPSMNLMQQDYHEPSLESDMQSCIWSLVFL